MAASCSENSFRDQRDGKNRFRKLLDYFSSRITIREDQSLLFSDLVHDGNARPRFVV
jgi:hypothetical protein